MTSTSTQSHPKTIWYLATEPIIEVQNFFAGMTKLFQVEYIHNEKELKAKAIEQSRHRAEGKPDTNFILMGDFSKTGAVSGGEVQTLFDRTDSKPYYVNTLVEHQIHSTIIPLSLVPEYNRGFLQWARLNNDFLEDHKLNIRGMGKTEQDNINPIHLLRSVDGQYALLALILGENSPIRKELVGVRQERVRA